MALTMDGFHKALGEDRAGVLAVLNAGMEIGLDPDELAVVIERESGWNPLARNPTSDARGLLQWMPSTRAALGMPDPIAGTRIGQAPWVKRFFEAIGRPIPPGDVYLATFHPKAVGKPDSYVIAEPSSLIWEQNAPWLRESSSGPITAGSVRRAGSALGHIPSPMPPKPEGSGMGVMLLATLFGILPFAIIVTGKKR